MSLPRRLVLATGNAHKLREFERLVPQLEFELLPEGFEMPEETGITYSENALIKARAAAEQTGKASIADDSGIEALALGGAPGVRSARYAGEHATDQENLDLFVTNVEAETSLRYVCVIAMVDPEAKAEYLFEGYCTGTMAHAPTGSNGFGYDPVFVPDGLQGHRTMAELGDQEKDLLSHRAIAARGLVSFLAQQES